MSSIAQILLLLLNVALWIILAQIIMSWLIQFQVLNLRQPVVYSIWSGLNRLLEPVYRKVRSFLPVTAGIDFAPLVVILVIYALRILIVNNLY